jgi:hypothetical protein
MYPLTLDPDNLKVERFQYEVSDAPSSILLKVFLSKDSLVIFKKLRKLETLQKGSTVCFSCEWPPSNRQASSPPPGPSPPSSAPQVIQMGQGYEVEQVEVQETNVEVREREFTGVISVEVPIVIIKISGFKDQNGNAIDFDENNVPPKMMMYLPSISLPDHSDDCDCGHCKILFVHRNFKHHSTISPFELALTLLYVHDIDKNQQKLLNVLDENLDQSKQRFIAALQVVEEMLVCDIERSRRESKANQKKIAPQDHEPETAHALDEAQKKYARCRSVDNFHYQFYSSSIARGILCCALFGMMVIFCAIWMAAGPSAELARWQSTISDAAFHKDDAQLASSYEDLTASLSALNNFSVPWPPESSFTRSLGSVDLRVIRIDTQSTSRCIASDNLGCVPTINVFPHMSPRPSMLPPAAFSSTPPTFSVPPYSNNFKYRDGSAPLRCGSVYCFDGSGYSFQAADSSEFVAALRSHIFDSGVRAIILSFTLYSPSLQAAYKGSYIAEVLPTGSVLGSYDAFVADYVNNIVLERIQLLTALKIIVSALTLCEYWNLKRNAGSVLHILLLYGGVCRVFAGRQSSCKRKTKPCKCTGCLCVYLLIFCFSMPSQPSMYCYRDVICSWQS